MEFDHNGLEVLTRAECMDLLASTSFGRIALTSQALPLILPVNYLVDGPTIVIRSRPGTKLDAATRHTVVAFEVDDVDPIYHSGWSVVVQGLARVVVDADEIDRLHRLPLAVWLPAEPTNFVTISTDLVTGRRLDRRSGAPVAIGAARMDG